MSYLEPPNRLKPPSLSSPVPGTPPRIKLGQLWISLILPPGLTILGLLMLFLAKSIDDQWFSVAIYMMGAGLIFGWVLFIICISKRYRGVSLVLLIIAYPLLEGTIVGALFFTGCFWVALTSWDGHGPPEESSYSPTAPRIVIASTEALRSEPFSQGEF